MVVRDVDRNLVESLILRTFQDRINDAGTLRCVLLHLIEFLRRELSGLSQDCIVDGDLAEIVHRRSLDDIPAELVCQTISAEKDKNVFLI